MSEIAALVGDRARGEMLSALVSGRALTAKELAYVAKITPQTTSEHLSKLVDAGIVPHLNHEAGIPHCERTKNQPRSFQDHLFDNDGTC